ncbi:ComEC/Rec2 family competence protein [Rothia sp. LK2588]|uniref:ComEC/Rec2 family competence protein n=1 Tax=Rothia sp. LK2588 TaxID=3114369 RepID=UPI0034D02170
MAAVLWVGTALALGSLCHPSVLSKLWWAVFIALGLCILGYFLTSHSSGVVPLVAIAALTLALGLTHLQASGITEGARLFANLDGRVVTVSGTTTRVKPLDSERTLIQVHTETITYRQQEIPGRTQVTAFIDHTPKTGGSLDLRGTIKIDGHRITLNNARMVSPPRDQPGLDHHLKNANAHALADRTQPDNAALMLGMVYGDDHLMEQTTREEFKTAGLTHLTAVSGANITLVFLVGYWASYFAGRPRTLNIAIGTLVTLLYATFVGWEGSVIRAWTMGIIGSLAVVLGHSRQSIPLWGTAVTALLLTHPHLSLDFGFVLSALATASIVILAPPMCRIIGSNLPMPLAQPVSLSLSASLWCAPVIGLLNAELGLYTVVANVLATPLVAPITLLSMTLLLLHNIVTESLTEPLLTALEILTGALLAIADICAHAPGARVDVSPPHTLIILVAFVVISSFTVLLADHLRYGRHPQQRTPRTTAHQKSSLKREQH